MPYDVSNNNGCMKVHVLYWNSLIKLGTPPGSQDTGAVD